MGKLASLVVDLQLQTAELRKGLDDANKRLSDFGKKTAGIGKLLAGALSFEVISRATQGIASFVQRGAQAAAQMGDLATMAGMSVEAFSGLAAASKDLAGVSGEELAGALGKLSKSMAAAFAGDGKEATVFEALGIAIQDANGKLRSSGDVFADLSDRFAGLEDGAAKTSLAIEVFGKSGAELLPLLNKGSEAIERSRKETAAFFGVTADGAQAAEDFNRSIARMQGIGEGLAMQVAQQLAPSMSALADEFLKTATASGTMSRAAEALANALRVLLSAGVIVGAVFEAAGKTLAAFASAAVSAIQGEFGEAKEALDALDQDMEKTVSRAQANISAVWTTQSTAAESANKATKKSADGILHSIKRIEKASKAANVSLGAKLSGPGGSTNVSAESDVGREVREKLEADREAARLRVAAAVDFEREVRDNATVRMSRAIEAVTGMITSSMGKFGGLVDSFASGMAATGGDPIGGLINAGLSLVSQSEGFARFVGMLDKVVKLFSDAFGRVFDALAPLIQISLMLDAALLELVEPFLRMAVDAAPFLFEALKFAATGMLVAARNIAEFWNAVFGGVQAVLRGIASLELFGVRPFAALNGVAQAMDALRFDVEGLDAAIDAISGTTYEQAAAQTKLTEATELATASMLNVPSGFKIDAARFNAIRGETSPPGVSASPSTSGSGPSSGAGGSGGAVPAVQQVFQVFLGGQELARAMRIELKQSNGRGAGSTSGLSADFAGAT